MFKTHSHQAKAKMFFGVAVYSLILSAFALTFTWCEQALISRNQRKAENTDEGKGLIAWAKSDVEIKGFTWVEAGCLVANFELGENPIIR